MPSAEALNGGLEILRTVDLRQALVRLPMPFLRLYGRLDGLVPRKIVPLLDDLWPESESILFDKAAHAPFVSPSRGLLRAAAGAEDAAGVIFLPRHGKRAIPSNT